MWQNYWQILQMDDLSNILFTSNAALKTKAAGLLQPL